jgi:hypothetical protein
VYLLGSIMDVVLEEEYVDHHPWEFMRVDVRVVVHFRSLTGLITNHVAMTKPFRTPTIVDNGALCLRAHYLPYLSFLLQLSHWWPSGSPRTCSCGNEGNGDGESGAKKKMTKADKKEHRVRLTWMPRELTS